VREDPRDDRRFEDGGDDLELAAADRAAQDVLVMRLEAARRDRLFLADTGFTRPVLEADHGRPSPRMESQLTGPTSYSRSRPIPILRHGQLSGVSSIKSAEGVPASLPMTRR